MNTPFDPRSVQAFRFVRASWDDAAHTASLVYALDEQVEFTERVVFPDAPALRAERRAGFDAALGMLHLIAGVSYFKAAVPPRIAVEGVTPDADTAQLMQQIYEHGLGEFAWQNQLDLTGRVVFPVGLGQERPPIPSPSPARGEGSKSMGAFHTIGIAGESHATHDAGERTAPSDAPALAPFPPRGGRAGDGGAVLAPVLNLQRRTLVPIGGGKDSLVSVEILRAAQEPATAIWIGQSDLIRACAQRTGIRMLNLRREVSPALFELNRRGALNGHVPVTAINSAVLVVAALLYDFDAIAFSNERSASSNTLEADGRAINHQWSKGLAFERAFGAWVRRHVAADLDYFSLLRPLSELAVTRRFARLGQYHAVFSSCNRNFKIIGERPATRWCGQCPKCHFVFLALAPFLPKPQLVAIFGRNLLDDSALAGDFDALLEWNAHKPFECVGEGRESRAAMAALAASAQWREDAVVRRFRSQILPSLAPGELLLEPLLAIDGEHRIPQRLLGALHASG